MQNINSGGEKLCPEVFGKTLMMQNREKEFETFTIQSSSKTIFAEPYGIR